MGKKYGKHMSDIQSNVVLNLNVFLILMNVIILQLYVQLMYTAYQCRKSFLLTTLTKIK
jgi:hypothetical protein